ncbi:hypothetical protein B7P43_G05937 [Cryptotermes secundus]|uniref:Uncharacterized protein n=1 Tax=Cryptotermes secundus TaxID=105785 RepID=A0A2J7QA64_9NEOP|nr:hypothetical protein B7P43_G05937 [Cryptotermes secundus]
MKCLNCPSNYIGLSGRTISIGYKEYIQAIRNNNRCHGYHQDGKEDQIYKYLGKMLRLGTTCICMTCINTYNSIFLTLHELYHR